MYLLAATLIAATMVQLPSWDFTQGHDTSGWINAGGITPLTISSRGLEGKVTGTGGFMVRDGIPPFAAEPNQYVVIRLKVSRGGEGQFLWAGDDGISWERRTPFRVAPGGKWQNVVIFPFWQASKTIKTLRIDLFGPCEFTIGSIKVESWGNGQPPATDVYSWSFRDSAGFDKWRIPGSDYFFAPPLKLNLTDRRFVNVRLKSSVDCAAAVAYGIGPLPGLFSEPFRIHAGATARDYSIELQGKWPGRSVWYWRDPVVGLGLEIPQTAQANIKVQSVSVSDKPSGPAELSVHYFGFDEAINRAGKPCALAAEIINIGGEAAENTPVITELPSGLRVAGGQTEQRVTVGPYTAPARVIWPLVASAPGEYTVRLNVGDNRISARLRFLPPVNAQKADYVPQPKPVKTDTDIFLYYYPGWDQEFAWKPIREVAPNRRTWLGYYDETRPETVDWQIKAAVENGISGFILDWYWMDNKPYLSHWLDAYEKARYRDNLKICLMWCDHIHTHSRQEFLDMVRMCVSRYFGWTSYYKIDNKPVFVIWDSDSLTARLGGPEGVKSAFDECEAFARQAGFAGIYFLESGMAMPPMPDRSRVLETEGYDAQMTYHDWMAGAARSQSGKQMRYKDIVDQATQTWAAKRAAAGKLTYLPVMESGWDSRPWHGDIPAEPRIIGRTPALFEALLRKAKADWETHKQPFVLLGPVNEYGEGSYLEPNVEFGFGMYEAVRNVFAKGDPKSWPVNICPSDVGMSIREYPSVPSWTKWSFADGKSTWRPFAGVEDFDVKDGLLRFRGVTNDPAVVAASAIDMGKFHKIRLRMSVSGITSGVSGRFYWGSRKDEFSESRAVGFPIIADGVMRDYSVDLPTDRPLGQTNLFRLDPCEAAGAQIAIEEIAFE